LSCVGAGREGLYPAARQLRREAGAKTLRALDPDLNATVTTPLFTVSAPKVRIIESGNRVKVQVLARAGEKKTTT